MAIRFDPAEFGPRAAVLIRSLVDEVNTLSSALRRERGSSALAENVEAIAGQQSRTVEQVNTKLATVYSKEETYSQEEIDAKDQAILASVPDAVPLPAVWTNNVDAASVAGDRVYAREYPEITGARVSTWTDTATGLLGTASSSRRFKDHIVPFDIAPSAVLSVEPKWYSYIAELRKRDDPTYENYVGPEYRVAIEPGMIAEDLHAAGLGAFVVYNTDGQPHGINYIMWVVALQAVNRNQQQQIDDLMQRVSALEK